MIRFCGSLLLLVSACASMAAAAQEPAPHQHASAPQAAVPLSSPIAISLDAATLAALPRESVTAFAHGLKLQCEGISLEALLRRANVFPEQPLRGAALSNYVLVTARDGYRAVFSLAEIEHTLGNHKVLLVDRCDGKPLAENDGPLRLIAPDESRAARWVRQVQTIAVVAAP